MYPCPKGQGSMSAVVQEPRKSNVEIQACYCGPGQSYKKARLCVTVHVKLGEL